jgi:inorganic pyrophosphatase
MVSAFTLFFLTSGFKDFWVNQPKALEQEWAQELNPLVVVRLFGDDPENHKYVLTVDGQPRSFWHDVPIHPGAKENLLHFVCEIPKGTTAKMEINKEAENNAIIQDRKKGKLRFYKYNPEVGSLVNYGAIPQTWEDPEIPDAETNLGGDNDPIDVLQVNAKPCKIGDIQRVKVLGAFALIDDGETDWKVLVVDVDSPEMTSNPNAQLADLKKPEELTEIIEWFRNYKTAEGKGLNKFGLDEKIIGPEESFRVVMDTHKFWKGLMQKKTKEGEL